MFARDVCGFIKGFTKIKKNGVDLLSFDVCSFHISFQALFGDNIVITYFFLAETYMICVNVFYVLRNEISGGSDKRHRISP